MKFKKFQNKIFVHMKTFDVTIFHILVHFIGSKVGLYVSFLICLYLPSVAFFRTFCKTRSGLGAILSDCQRKMMCLGCSTHPTLYVLFGLDDCEGLFGLWPLFFTHDDGCCHRTAKRQARG